MKRFSLLIAVSILFSFVALTFSACDTETPPSSSVPLSSSVPDSTAETSEGSEKSESSEISSEDSEESEPISESSFDESSKSEPEISSGDSSSEFEIQSSQEDESSDSEISQESQGSESSESEWEWEASSDEAPGYIGPFGLVGQTGAVDDSYFDDAIMVGDSLTEGIKLYSVMKNATVISNVGINLSTIKNKAVISHEGTKITIPEAMKLYPEASKIYIMLGANGISWMGKTTFINLYGEFIDLVKKQHPEATIYIQSVLPINEALFKEHYGQDLTNEKIDSYNAALEDLCEEKEVYYLNVAECLKDSSGGMSSQKTSDGMHIGKKSYQRWFEYLKTHTVYSDSNL